MSAALHIPRTSSARSFTLTELLVVIAILGLLAALSIPSLKGLADAGTLAAGGNMATGLADMARQSAMTMNQPTALVVVTQVGGGTDTNNAYRTMGLYGLLAATDASPAQWTPLTPWKRLDNHVVFDASGTSLPANVANFCANTGTTSLPFATSAIRIGSVPVAACAYAVFLPTGQLYQQSYPVRLRLLPAHGIDTMNPANYYDIVINNDTGRTKIVRP